MVSLLLLSFLFFTRQSKLSKVCHYIIPFTPFMLILNRIWRNDDPENSVVHFFTSHFFAMLDDEGPLAVSSWIAKKNIDIFQKRFIFIPINEGRMWSLCVVVNPGSIENEFKDEEDQSDDQDFPFILFLDSFKPLREAHQKVKASVAKKVRRWLNYEAKRLGKFKETFEHEANLFNWKTMEVFEPKGKQRLVTSTFLIFLDLQLSLIFSKIIEISSQT